MVIRLIIYLVNTPKPFKCKKCQINRLDHEEVHVLNFRKLRRLNSDSTGTYLHTQLFNQNQINNHCSLVFYPLPFTFSSLKHNLIPHVTILPLLLSMLCLSSLTVHLCTVLYLSCLCAMSFSLILSPNFYSFDYRITF